MVNYNSRLQQCVRICWRLKHGGWWYGDGCGGEEFGNGYIFSKNIVKD